MQAAMLPLICLAVAAASAWRTVRICLISALVVIAIADIGWKDPEPKGDNVTIAPGRDYAEDLRARLFELRALTREVETAVCDKARS